ncbi:hypothetical protein MACH09_46630 [Vibrio sp. MACH09]|uniref:hypothetical protein n=1 Tax=Vibrio sp. MACH09 TaxID=3025122 RepID=UPI002794CF84|nr:hypothetical protein [Vibrio sp. MACH09]GLO64155.1 hypothetical protein MACH09_46630 [Vibrio sp. MACH09]
MNIQDRVSILSEFSALPRSNVSFQILMMFSWLEQGLDNSVVIKHTFQPENKDYYELNSLVEIMTEKQVMNAFKATRTMYLEGFLEKIVIDHLGNVSKADESKSKKFANIYYRLSDKSKALFDLD